MRLRNRQIPSPLAHKRSFPLAQKRSSPPAPSNEAANSDDPRISDSVDQPAVIIFGQNLSQGTKSSGYGDEKGCRDHSLPTQTSEGSQVSDKRQSLKLFGVDLLTPPIKLFGVFLVSTGSSKQENIVTSGMRCESRQVANTSPASATAAMALLAPPAEATAEGLKKRKRGRPKGAKAGRESERPGN